MHLSFQWAPCSSTPYLGSWLALVLLFNPTFTVFDLFFIHFLASARSIEFCGALDSLGQVFMKVGHPFLDSGHHLFSNSGDVGVLIIRAGSLDFLKGILYIIAFLAPFNLILGMRLSAGPSFFFALNLSRLHVLHFSGIHHAIFAVMRSPGLGGDYFLGSWLSSSHGVMRTLSCLVSRTFLVGCFDLVTTVFPFSAPMAYIAGSLVLFESCANFLTAYHVSGAPADDFVEMSALLGVSLAPFLINGDCFRSRISLRASSAAFVKDAGGSFWTHVLLTFISF